MIRIVVLFIILSLQFLLVSCKDCRNIQVPYYEEEPYQDIETTSKILSFKIENDKIYYKRESGAIVFGDNPKLIVSATVTNTDDLSGDFTLTATVESQGDFVNFEKSIFINAHETVEIIAEKEINPFTFQANVEIKRWNVEPPTVSYEKQVTKFRTITKYRPCNTCEQDCD